MINMAEEIRLIKLTKAWPRWPRLPMKNKQLVPPGHMPECGFIFASDVEKGKPVVYLENFFATLSRESLRNVKQMPFESVEEMVAAGWQGD